MSQKRVKLVLVLSSLMLFLLFGVHRTIYATENNSVKVLILQDNEPWDAGLLWLNVLSNRVVNVNGRDILVTAELKSSYGLPSLVPRLNDYQFIVVPGDQNGTFNANLSNYMYKIDEWVRNGGTLIFSATTQGWHSAGLEWKYIPGGIGYTSSYFDEYNYNIKPEHPIMKDVPLQIYGTYASHGYFYNLPPNAEILAVDSANRPTLVVYPYGKGLVVASATTMEYAYTHNQGYKNLDLLFFNITNYVLKVIMNHPPVIQSTEYSPPEPAVNTFITLKALAVDPDNDPLTYVWKATTPDGKTVDLGQGPYLTFKPDIPGVWRITLVVYDPYGAQDSRSISINVGAFNLNAVLVPEQVTRGQKLTVYVSLVNPEGKHIQADTILATLPNGQTINLRWDAILSRYVAEYLIPDGGSPGVWPGDGSYTIKVQATKYGVTKEDTLRIVVKGNIKEKLYIRQLVF